MLGTSQTVTVLALICPSPRTSDETYVVVGTNASHVRRLVNQCIVEGTDVTKTLGFRVSVQEGQPALKGTAVPARDDEAGRVRWMGPGPLILLQVLVYLDDLIVFGRTLEEHEERLLKVWIALEKLG
ncbi:hypothetical protein D4764_0289870 [Takifugu flavidus]|uniref:Reverse transcriptase domain-containing protein n=1 Tax=Takifugu flavidus TaxID=433684 RepID=A0A5C6ML71_9TELE|nr:hypothetical protein D4764_0289870 [Takifugu flavidus]